MKRIVELAEGEESNFHAARNGSGASTQIPAGVSWGNVPLCGEAKEVE